MENTTTQTELNIQKKVKTLFPNAILVNKPNSNYPFIIASNYSEDRNIIDYYLSTHMQQSKTELEAWQNAEIWINNTLGNVELYKSLTILELSKEQQNEHLHRLNSQLKSNNEYLGSFNSEIYLDNDSLNIVKQLKDDIEILNISIEESTKLFYISNIGYGKITLKDLQTLPAAILLHVDSELYTFDPNKKMNNLSDEEFNKLLKSKETKNDIVLIHFKTDYIAMTQSITNEDLKPIYLNDLKLLSDKQTGMYLFKNSVAVKQHPNMIDKLDTNRFSKWINEDSDNDGLTNGEELYRGTNPYNSDTDGDGIIDGVEVSQNTNPLEVNIQMDDAAPDAKEYFEKDVLKHIGTDFNIIQKEMKLENDLGDILIYNWKNCKIKNELGIYSISQTSLPKGTKYRIIPIKETSTENTLLYQIQKKHSIFGWRNNKTSSAFPKMTFYDKTEALKVFNKMQTSDINKSKGLKI